MTPQQRARLDAAISAVCPIDGTSGDPPRIDFRPEATPQQRAAADAVAAAFDPEDAAALAAFEEDRQPERKAIRQAATQAVADNDTFLALATPTNAQVVAQVKRLTQQNTRIIRRLAQVE